MGEKRWKLSICRKLSPALTIQEMENVIEYAKKESERDAWRTMGISWHPKGKHLLLIGYRLETEYEQHVRETKEAETAIKEALSRDRRHSRYLKLKAEFESREA